VIQAKEDTSVQVNSGTAQRSNWLADLENKRSQAKLNICTFHCQPRKLPFDVTMLERHEFSTQAFIPMNAERYLVVTCLV